MEPMHPVAGPERTLRRLQHVDERPAIRGHVVRRRQNL
jgi:hypothetical protein